MSDDEIQLVNVMNQVADALKSRPEADDTLAKITRTACEFIPGVDEASLSMTDSEGKIKTVAPTSVSVRRPDEIQYELSEGPCVDAIKFQQTMRSEDLANDRQWPRYGPQAVALGFHCQMAVQLYDSPTSHAALNLYSGSQGALDGAVHIAELFASQASVAMGFSRSVETLKEALATRNSIGKAIGITMQRFGLDEEHAFAFLVRVSQTRNLKLRVVADELLGERQQLAS